KATTAAIPFDADGAAVQAALDALTMSPGGTPISFAGGFSVGKVGSAYTVTFQGDHLGGIDVAPLSADAGKLRNTTALGTIGVTLNQADTTSNAIPDDLVEDLQAKINDALIAAGLTPGFLTTGATPVAAGTTFTATFVPFGAPQFLPEGPH